MVCVLQEGEKELKNLLLLYNNTMNCTYPIELDVVAKLLPVVDFAADEMSRVLAAVGSGVPLSLSDSSSSSCTT